jgi:spermidine/putrescine transport system ATP-binding protein
VSFTGLSTQYLVRTAWGQEISVFAQNAGGERRVAVGESITVAWRPEHTFPLDLVAPTAEVPGPAPTTMAGAPA